MRLSLLASAALLAACSAGPGGGGPVDTGPPVDGGDDGDDDGGDGFDRDSGEPPALRCPPEMSPVPAADPAFCIDTWEVSDGGAVATSAPGASPLVGITFDDARALCAATPVLDEAGAPLGWKRLATLAEWRDAADGTLGDGGLPYPTGADWPGDVCALPDADGTPTLDDLQPTGSFPDCVSPFGVYDQLGNAWEWADPQLSLDRAAFLSARAAEGLTLAVGADGALSVSAGSPEGLALEIPGLQGDVGVLDGRVVATGVHFQAEEPFVYAGYLFQGSAETEASADWLLPVEVVREESVEDAETAPLLVRLEEDGAPVTAKVGCAWYAGGSMGCRNTDRFFGHPHTFNGTIGLRCAADPLP